MNVAAHQIDITIANLKPELDNSESWFRRATVRTTARIELPDLAAEELLFPPSRQVLADHPRVQAMGDEAVRYVLAQSAYQYMYEIGLLETRFVIDCSLDIVNGVIPGFGDISKREALAVVIDEGYHAYVALDFIMQMRQKLAIEPLFIPETNNNLRAVNHAYSVLPPYLHTHFQLIAVTLAEHTLTKDLLAIGSEKSATESFTKVMTDHVADEGRHANFFMRATTNYWHKLPEQTKQELGEFLPGYIERYLAYDTDRDFDRDVLSHLGLDKEAIDQILADTQPAYLAKATAYFTRTVKQLVGVVKQMGLLEHEGTHTAFKTAGLID